MLNFKNIFGRYHNHNLKLNVHSSEQLAAKLQNLKTQFRNRKSAVEEGKESKTNWKWYNMMEDLAQAETGLRESFDGNKVNLKNSKKYLVICLLIVFDK